MLKKKIKYTDFNGEEMEEEFYFNISKSELSKAQLSVDGGLDVKLQKVIDSKSSPEILKMYNEFIDLSYGIKSDDGKHFRKSKEILDDFKSSPAYDELFMELINNPNKIIEFIKGVFPVEIAAHFDEDPDLQKLIEKANSVK